MIRKCVSVDSHIGINLNRLYFEEEDDPLPVSHHLNKT